MKEILDKITSYNLFNYLLPGVLFVVTLEKFTSYSFTQENLIIGAFVYYFVGLVISRFGSLVVEPILKFVHFLKFAPYVNFVSATKIDSKIDELSEANNMYRTFVSMLMLLILAKIYETYSYQYTFLSNHSMYVVIFVLLIMFLFSYKKQISYIKQRVESTK